MYDRPLQVTCDWCKGTGRLGDGEPVVCPNCKGSGKVPSSRGREILDLLRNHGNVLRVEDPA